MPEWLPVIRRRLVAGRTWWDAKVEPTVYGLPTGWALLLGWGLLAAVWVVLVATSLNGTSSGAFHPMVYSGADPALVYGRPNLIRTDEWNVQTVWAIAQAQQGLPSVNQTFPGGMDTTLPQDLPRLDWSSVFRPHLWGFWFLDVDHAQAWKWWSPVFGLAGAAYAFCLVHMPRRPLLSMTLAVAFTSSPFFQWWLLQTTLWPVAWGLFFLAAAAWCVRDDRAWARVAWNAGLAYLTVVMVMGIYVPFILPVALVALLAGIGTAFEAARRRDWKLVSRRIAEVAIAVLAAGAITGAWLLTRQETVQAFLSTAYPGERLEPTGTGDLPAVAALLGSSFTNALTHAGTFLNGNASESATFFLPGVFLSGVVAWMVWSARRRGDGIPWAPVLALVGALILLAFMFLPGWDAVAHLLFLDRTTLGRARIGLGFASFVLLLFVLARATTADRPNWVLSAAGPVLFLLTQGGIAAALATSRPDLLRLSGYWWVVAVVGAVAILAAARGWRAVAAMGFLAISVAGSYQVNPLYLGVFDLRETEPGAMVRAVDSRGEGAWVGLGGQLTSALLLESGVRAYNGFQGAPIAEMWDAVDPEGRYEFQWNRLAGVSWVPGEGEPVVSNPYPDQIVVTFDACSDFAQANVRYVLSDGSQHPASDCLERVDELPVNQTILTAWEIVPEG